MYFPGTLEGDEGYADSGVRVSQGSSGTGRIVGFLVLRGGFSGKEALPGGEMLGQGESPVGPGFTMVLLKNFPELGKGGRAKSGVSVVPAGQLKENWSGRRWSGLEG